MNSLISASSSTASSTPATSANVTSGRSDSTPSRLTLPNSFIRPCILGIIQKNRPTMSSMGSIRDKSENRIDCWGTSEL